MANKAGYCEDLAYASLFGEEKATKLFKRTCGKIDTAYSKLDQDYTKTTILSRVITYQTSDNIKFVFKQKYASQQGDSIKEHSAGDAEVINGAEGHAEFPGGLGAMQKFMASEIQMPPSIMGREGRHRVFLKFIVFEDGTIHNITVLKGVPNCSECDEEATRAIAIMPRWKPANK